MISIWIASGHQQHHKKPSAATSARSNLLHSAHARGVPPSATARPRQHFYNISAGPRCCARKLISFLWALFCRLLSGIVNRPGGSRVGPAGGPYIARCAPVGRRAPAPDTATRPRLNQPGRRRAARPPDVCIISRVNRAAHGGGRRRDEPQSRGGKHGGTVSRPAAGRRLLPQGAAAHLIGREVAAALVIP